MTKEQILDAPEYKILDEARMTTKGRRRWLTRMTAKSSPSITLRNYYKYYSLSARPPRAGSRRGTLCEVSGVAGGLTRVVNLSDYITLVAKFRLTGVVNTPRHLL